MNSTIKNEKEIENSANLRKDTVIKEINTKRPKCMYTNSKKHKKCVMLYECLCGKKFCILHRLPHNHECTFNHKERSREILEKNNPQVIAEKIISI